MNRSELGSAGAARQPIVVPATIYHTRPLASTLMRLAMRGPIMSQLPDEREITFEMPRGEKTTVGYNPQALARYFAGIDIRKVFSPQDDDERREGEDALIECLIPALYSFECTGRIYMEVPFTRESFDDSPEVILERLLQEVLDDFWLLVKPEIVVN